MIFDQNWKTIISRKNDVIYLSSWFVCVENKQCFDIIWKKKTLSSSQNFLISIFSSFKNVFEFLIKFYLLHDLNNQCFAIFATTLIFSTFNHYEIVVTLFFFAKMKNENENNSMKFIASNLIRMSEKFFNYMILNCNHNIIVSNFCEIFWKSNISCNFVNFWLHFVMNKMSIMKKIINFKNRYHEIFVIMCVIRRFKFFVFWFEIVINELISKIFDFVKNDASFFDFNVFAWTSYFQFFMNFANSNSYFQIKTFDEKIQKTNVWRFFFLFIVVENDFHCENYLFASWKFVEKINANNCMIRIKIHRFYFKHYLIYQHWTWHLKNDLILIDEKLKTISTQISFKKMILKIETSTNAIFFIVKFSLDQKAFRKTFWKIFQWMTTNGEKISIDELIYKNEWLRDEIVNEISNSFQNDVKNNHIKRFNSNTMSCDIFNENELISSKTILNTISSIQKININNWFKKFHWEKK